jgi:5-methylcytosine-specific restriction endonuclease McrA
VSSSAAHEHPKRCSGCELTQPVANFSKNGRARDGLQVHCKTCQAETQRAYRARRPEKMRELGRNQMRRRREADPEAEREYMRKWRAANPDKVRASKKAWNAANYEKVRAAANAANARYKAAHPEKRREGDLLRRARKVAASVGEVDLEALWVAQAGACGLCGHDLDPGLAWPEPKSPSVDHIIPLSRGGTHAQGNLQWACLDCNLSKGARLPKGAAA